jgi:CoA:oxalate CoA-transferase
MTRKIDDRSGTRVPVLDSPYRYSDASAGVRGLPAFRGEDNREVLSEVLGMDEQAIEDLERTGVISARVPEN